MKLTSDYDVTNKTQYFPKFFGCYQLSYENLSSVYFFMENLEGSFDKKLQVLEDPNTTD